MHTVSAFFPVARPRDAAALLLAAPAGHRSHVTDAVALAFAVRGAVTFALPTAGVLATARPA